MHRLLLLPVLAALVLAAGSAGAGSDRDLDGFPDLLDNCPTVFNPDQADADEDGIGNSCDSTPGVQQDESKLVLYLRDQRGLPVTGACFTATVTKSDGVEEADDVCGDVVDPGWAEIDLQAPNDVSVAIAQTSAPPGCAGGLRGSQVEPFAPASWKAIDVRYRCGTPDVDRDYDGVSNDVDNCPNVFNPDQADDDEDGIGNTCDTSPGVSSGTSQLVLYLRDQDGAALWNACFEITLSSASGPQEPMEACVDLDAPGWLAVELDAPDDLAADVVQTATPPGCRGGLLGHLSHVFSAGAWRAVALRYACGAPATFRDVLTRAKPQADHVLRVVHATKQIVLRLTWPKTPAAFDLTGLNLAGRRLAGVDAGPVRLSVTRRRTATSLVVRIEQQRPTKLKPGKLKPGALAGTLSFSVVGRKLFGTARTTTRITQAH